MNKRMLQSKKNYLIASILLLLTYFRSTTYANSNSNIPKKATMLDQITVTATRTEQSLDDVPSTVSVKTSDDIEKNQDQNIKDLMRYEPGVEVGSDGRFGLKGFNIRGMDGNRVKIMVDGVDQAESFNPYVNLFLKSNRNFIDVETLKTVEVVKGSSSTLYGTSALGGTVSFMTKDPEDYLNDEKDDSYASVKTGYSGADQGFSETLTLAGRQDKLETLFLYTRRDSSETKTMGTHNVEGFARDVADPQDNAINSFLDKIQYKISDTNKIGFTAEFYDSDSNSNLLSQNDEKFSGYSSRKTYYKNSSAEDTAERKRIGFNQEWQANLSAFDQLNWQLDWQDSKTLSNTFLDEEKHNLITTTTNRALYYQYNQEDISLSTQFNKALDYLYQQELIYGINYKHMDQDNLGKEYSTSKDTSITIKRYAPLATVQNLNFFLQDQINMTDQLQIIPGIRYDWFKTDPKVDGYFSDFTEVTDLSERIDSKWTAQLGGVYKFNEAWTGFAQIGQGYKTPDVTQMYFGFDGTHGGMHIYDVLPNPDLKPEKSNSLEVGARMSDRFGGFESSVFYNTYNDFIELTQEGVFPASVMKYQYKNITTATIGGVELKGQLFLDELYDAIPLGFTAHGAFSYAKGNGKQTGEASQPLNSISPAKFVFGLSYDDPEERWGTEATLTLVSDKDPEDIDPSAADGDTTGGSLDNPQFAPSGYGIADLTAYYKPEKAMTIRGGIFNITDKAYYLWDDVRGISSTYEGRALYSQPGRNISVNFKWEL